MIVAPIAVLVGRSMLLLPPVDQDPEAVRDEACDITVEDRLCEPPPDYSPSDGGGRSGGLEQLLALLLVLALIGLLVYLIAQVVSRRAASRSKNGSDTNLDGLADDDEQQAIRPVIVDRSREPSGWRAEADQHRASGRYRDAIRCRYRALVGDLARCGLIDEIPGRTTGEERMQLRAVAPTAHPSFTAAADLFDGAWFGNIEVRADDDDEFVRLENDVLATTASPARTAAGRRRA